MRIVTSGAEFQAATTTVNQSEGEGFRLVGPPTVETTVVRSGAAAWRAAGANQYCNWAQTTSDANDYFIRGYFRWPSAPAGAQILITAMPGTQGTVRTIAGTTTVALYDDANVQVGSASGSLAVDTWHMVEMAIGITSGRLQCRVNGELLAGGLTSGADLATQITDFRVGNFAADTSTVYWDDVAINDSTGGVDDSWPGPGKIVLLKPVSDQQRDTNWITGGGGGSSLFDELNNTPPVANHGALTGYIINAASTTTQTYTAATGTYAAAGVTAADRIKIVQAVAAMGDTVATAMSYGLKLDANPSDTEVTGSTNASSGTGIYPSGYIAPRGTLNTSPSVTITDPVRVKVRKNTASTDGLTCALLGVYVEYAEPLLLNLSDSVTASEATSAGPETAQADSVTASESRSAEPNVGKADTVTALDATASDVTTQQADTASVSDSQSLEAGLNPADSVTATDALVTEDQAALADSVTASDSAAMEVQTELSDSVTVSESPNFELYTDVPLADTITVTDAQAFDVEVSLADLVTASDAMVTDWPVVTDTSGGGWAMPRRRPLVLRHDLNLADLVLASDRLRTEVQMDPALRREEELVLALLA